ncbi:hypothetical protein [Flavobacterium sp. CSZ]|uniref:hypothetical protein n=1 Tax=Flavobacterium sp. CSZ TaxID=2783791 RepID=UPI00188A44B5|nr:hypothetical protein [Flavobacterium sp. CSZ]MBF4484014.1 hypothetical protein [Flavobacterium sp. CSZ]
MTIPLKEIEKILFEQTVNTEEFVRFIGNFKFTNHGDFENINWLNTPGPIYTSCTDNCGTGQVEAMNNVGGDEDYHEVIFKQPLNEQELKEILTAASIDPYDAYYFDGNKNWTSKLIIDWWSKSQERITYILDCYQCELNLPDILDRPLYGPRIAIPENYKNWLDFYQSGMKEYLEWYISKIDIQLVTLTELNFDWTRKDELDNLLKSKKIIANPGLD